MSNPGNIVNMQDPTIPVQQSIYEDSSTQMAKLGTRLRMGERTFYYAQLSTAANVVAGNVLCSPTAVTTAMGATVAVDTAAAGKNYITATVGTNIPANFWAEGYAIIASSAVNGGLMFKIRQHSSIGSGATGAIIYLYDDIPQSISTLAAGPLNLIPSPFSGVGIGSLVLDNPIGVVVSPTVTTGNYCWLQTWGPAAPIHTAASAIAADLTLGTLGTVVALRTGTEGGGATAKSIGKNINLAATANWTNPIFLTIMP